MLADLTINYILKNDETKKIKTEYWVNENYIKKNVTDTDAFASNGKEEFS